MKLSELAPPKGARKTRKRLGKGEGSGLGKTCGRGGKGQTARAGGGVRPGFEGGQMPLYRRIPKVGFTSRQRVLGLNQYDLINLDALDRFDTGTTITPELLYSSGYRGRAKNRAGIKILGNGSLTKRLDIKVHAVSSSARQKIEALGGTIELLGTKTSEPA